MDKKQILVVENDTALSGVIVNILEIHGLEGSAVETGEETLNLLKETKYHFIILDLSLPDTTGIELYKKIVKSYPAYKGRVTFCSGHSISAELAQIMKEDQLFFLPKPFSLDKFKEIIQKWN